MSNAARQAPAVSGPQVISAGFASATAAFVTSRFGVAGTILGAALATMIITGGSAILRAYLESVTGGVRKVPRKLRERRNRWKAGRSAEPPETMPGRPDLRDNLAGRMRAALGWFSHLSPVARRSILVKGLVAAAVAFVIGMAAVYAIERGIGNSLSCGLWAKCPEGATPGIHLGGGDGTGAGSTLSLGRAKGGAAPGYGAPDPSYRQEGGQEGPGLQQPAPRGNEPGRGIFAPDRPPGQKGPQQPPSSPSPAPEAPVPNKPGVPPKQDAPPDASPAPSR